MSEGTVPAISCPSCGGPLPLRTLALPYCVCSHCRAVVLRDGTLAPGVGQARALPFDVSPLQLGVTGRFEGTDFTAGWRARWGWVKGSWNEWTLELADGNPAWLVEAASWLVLYRSLGPGLDALVAEAFPRGHSIALGAKLEIDGSEFTAVSERYLHCLGFEGELAQVGSMDFTSNRTELVGPGGLRLSVQRDALTSTALFGKVVHLGELAVQGLRRFEGWTLPAGLR